MKQSQKSVVVGNLLTGLLSLVLVGSAVFKLTLDPLSTTGLEFSDVVGIALLKPLALIEFALCLLLWIPRTSTLGYILTFGYFSGATATHLTHASPLSIQPVLMGLTLLAGFFRAPELFSRLVGSEQPGKLITERAVRQSTKHASS